MDTIAKALGIAPIDVDYENITYFEYWNGEEMRGDKNPMKNPDIKELHLVVVRSEEYRQKMSEIKTGTTHTEDTKRKMSETAKRVGTGKWCLGKKKTETTRKRMSESALKRERVPCKKCGKTYTKANINKHEIACNDKSLFR